MGASCGDPGEEETRKPQLSLRRKRYLAERYGMTNSNVRKIVRSNLDRC